MIRIPTDPARLEHAKDAHADAVIHYVQTREKPYQTRLFRQIAALIPSSNDFETLLAQDNWSWLRDFILADVHTLSSWTAHPEHLQFEEFKTLYAGRFCNGASTYVDRQAKYNAYALCKNLNITVCPYCDAEYLDLLESDEKRSVRTLEIDHFFPKSVYPALAMCFFNLIPSGQACNGIKLSTLLGANPYEEDIKTWTHLYPDFPIGIDMDKVKIDDCRIRFHPRLGMIQNTDVLRLEERYERHKSIAHKYIQNLQRYPDEKIDEYVRMGFFASRETAYRDLFDLPLPEDCSQPLLTKLRRDIVGK